jgi:hypothetical protein
MPEEVAEAVGAGVAAEATAVLTSAVAGTAAATSEVAAISAAVGRTCAAAARGSPAGLRYPDRQGDRLSAAIVRLPSAIPQEIARAATPA